MGRIHIFIPEAEFLPNFSGHYLDRGRYRILESIGSGAFGKVYRAVDMSRRTSKHQVFAIKCLHKPERGSPAYSSQKREFEHHKLVSGHPNIVAFHRCFSDMLFVYIILDIFNGGDLFSGITEKHLFDHGDDRLIKSVFIQLIDAVAHCHRVGVFHRDIKPENVMCSDDGEDIRLTDFGLSIMSPYSKDFGCGSSYYMSPECLGRQVHRREYATRPNDIWALGVILTNIITARNPWRYAVMRDGCFAEYMKNNDFLKTVLPISEGVNDILKDIFVMNPSRRLTLANLRRRILALEVFSTLDFVEKEVPCSDSAEVAGNTERQLSLFVPVHVHGSFNDAFKSAGSLTVPFSDSSRPESKGPFALSIDDLSVHIPDISHAVLGDSVGLQKSSIVYKFQEGLADIFRAAVRRMKILPKAGETT